MRAWHAGVAIVGGRDATSIRPPSASRSTTPATSWAIPSFPRRRCARWRRCAPTSSPATASGPSACWPIPTWRRRARRTPARSSPGRGWPGRASAIGWRPSRSTGPTPALPATPPARWWRRADRCWRSYGYGIEPTGGFDPLTEFVVTAFQRHFRPERVDGRIDQSTITTLERLTAALPARRPRHERRAGRAARGWPGRSTGSTCAPCWC